MLKEKSMKETITYCINNNIMREFLREHSGEVINMLTAEFDIEKYGRVQFKSGEKQGIEKGVEKVAINAIKKNIPVEDVADMTGLTIEKIKELKDQNK